MAVNDTRRQLVSPRSRPAAWNGSARRRDRCGLETWGEQARDNDSETRHSLPARTWLGLEYAEGVVSRVVDQPFGGPAPASGDAPVLSRVNLQ
jgi:hypothetical protein